MDDAAAQRTYWLCSILNFFCREKCMNHFEDNTVSFEKELKREVSEKTAKHSRRIQCPECGKKTKTHIYEDTILLRFPLYCSKMQQRVHC